jgi:hypothetical protein
MQQNPRPASTQDETLPDAESNADRGQPGRGGRKLKSFRAQTRLNEDNAVTMESVPLTGPVRLVIARVSIANSQYPALAANSPFKINFREGCETNMSRPNTGFSPSPAFPAAGLEHRFVGRIMRRGPAMAAHLLQLGDAPGLQTVGNRNADGGEILVVGRATYPDVLSFQEESLVRIVANRPDAERCDGEIPTFLSDIFDLLATISLAQSGYLAPCW